MIFIGFQHVGIVANYSKNFQIVYSDLLDKLQNTLSLVLSCSKNCFQHVGVQLVIDEVMNNYINFIYCAFYLFPTCLKYCKLFLKKLHYINH